MCFLANFFTVGNPTSSLVTFTLFVKPALKLLTGQKPTSTIIQAKIQDDIYLDPRPEYHRCILGQFSHCFLELLFFKKKFWKIKKNFILDFTSSKGIPLATSTGSQCSANINSCSKAQGLIIVPQKDDSRDKIEKGSILNVMLFDEI